MFADLGYADAEKRQTKLRLVDAINGVIAKQSLTRTATAKKLRINQPKISALANYKLDGFSVERLMAAAAFLLSSCKTSPPNGFRSEGRARGTEWHWRSVVWESQTGTLMSVGLLILSFVAVRLQLARIKRQNANRTVKQK